MDDGADRAVLDQISHMIVDMATHPSNGASSPFTAAASKGNLSPTDSGVKLRRSIARDSFVGHDKKSSPEDDLTRITSSSTVTPDAFATPTMSSSVYVEEDKVYPEGVHGVEHFQAGDTSESTTKDEVEEIRLRR